MEVFLKFIVGFCYFIFAKAHWRASAAFFQRENNLPGWFNLFMSAMFAALLAIEMGF